MEEERSYLGLLTGIARQTYYQDAEITDDLLKNELYPNLSEEEFMRIRHQCANLIKSMAVSDMDFNQLEAFLTSQVKRKGGITNEQSKILSKFWKTHKAKIHSSLVAKSCWNQTLKDFRWRTDLKSCTKDNNDVNVPIAIVDLEVENKCDENQVSHSIKFEIEKEKLDDIVSSLKEIELILNNYCKK
ncbi:COMM domain-containing protein 1-like [Centruroides sculpturatus]|uniref:COMM domain-containing protein 1-like n=1 Tax=Centruroides sculpturatus TaxID=218467 RepID=UPI000C6DACD1|nr:COMM domain-containing protein 1-like [Centruroides sculpturatus]